jgi:hypothetical protein
VQVVNAASPAVRPAFPFRVSLVVGEPEPLWIASLDGDEFHGLRDFPQVCRLEAPQAAARSESHRQDSHSPGYRRRTPAPRPAGARSRLEPAPNRVRQSRGGSTYLLTPTCQTWVPAEDLIHTDRLCSAGSESPRSSPASELGCSPPTSQLLWPRFYSQAPLAPTLPAAYLDAGACSLPAAHAPANARRVGDGSPALRKTGFFRGEARTSPGYVGRPLPARRGRNAPLDTTPPCPYFFFEKIHGEAAIAFRQFSP